MYSLGIIDIIKAVLNGQPFGLDENFEKVDFEKLYAFSKMHHLAAFVPRCPEVFEKMPEEIKQKFRYEMNINIAKDTAQTVIIGAFLEQMEKAGLRAMPLKGYFIKNLYPGAELRYMTDTDILVDVEHLEKIRPIMEALGFKYDHESDHEVIYKSPQLVVELHKMLIPEHKSRLREYYLDGWSLAEKIEGKNYIYKFSKENLYIYIVGHIAKHYSDGGIGITHVIDVYLQNKQDMDMDYVNGELKKVGLETFHRILTEVANMWFSDENIEYSNEAKAMSGFILSGGSFGSETNRISAKLNRKIETSGKETVSKGSIILKMIFPPPSHIKRLYPSVKKCILLYPFCVIARIFKICFFRKKEIKKLSTVMNTDKSDMDFFKNHCEEMGLPKDL